MFMKPSLLSAGYATWYYWA